MDCESKLNVEQCGKCGLPHRHGKTGPRIAYRTDGGCTFCGAKRRRSSRYCGRHANQYNRGHRQKHRDLSPEQKLKARARAYLNTYLRKGRVEKKPCNCGVKRVQAHHHDYAFPLDVEWLCKKHHRERHGH